MSIRQNLKKIECEYFPRNNEFCIAIQFKWISLTSKKLGSTYQPLLCLQCNIASCWL